MSMIKIWADGQASGTLDRLGPRGSTFAYQPEAPGTHLEVADLGTVVGGLNGNAFYEERSWILTAFPRPRLSCALRAVSGGKVLKTEERKLETILQP